MRGTALAALLLGIPTVGSMTLAGAHHTMPTDASLAARAAIAYVGGRWATGVRPGAPGVEWEFHVLRRDGSVTEVLLDEQLELVDVGDSPSLANGRAPERFTLHHAHTLHSARSLHPTGPEDDRDDLEDDHGDLDDEEH